ncbi:MAG: hypothetical protein H0W69_07225 [Gemmatimonadaceae bacterium]|nr:hypothetical protein [Gemmatimonadaceae bacterium]
MKNILRVGAIAAVALALSAGAASAQGLGFGVNAGAAMPTGNTLDYNDIGYNVGASIFLRPAVSPLSFRIDGNYASMGGSTENAITRPDLKVLSGTANLQFGLGGEAVKLYAVGGAGVYTTQYERLDRSGIKLGFNGGFGVNLPLSGFNTSIEARLHYIQADDSGPGLGYQRGSVTFIPVTFGINF